MKLIEPIAGEMTHIEAHKELNKHVTQFYNRLAEIDDKIDKAFKSLKDVDENNSSAFSQIKEIEKSIKTINKTLGTIGDEIKNLNDKINRGRKYLVKTFEGILDTDTQITIDLERIELDGTYLVNIVENDIFKNESVMAYSVGHTVIANNEYTPRVYLQSTLGGHAVLEYDFTVILTEI